MRSRRRKRGNKNTGRGCQMGWDGINRRKRNLSANGVSRPPTGAKVQPDKVSGMGIAVGGPAAGRLARLRPAGDPGTATYRCTRHDPPRRLRQLQLPEPVRPGTPSEGGLVLQVAVAPVPADLPEYDRDEWRHWTDEDGDCQNVRQEVLIAESAIAVEFSTDEQCRVSSGRWRGRTPAKWSTTRQSWTLTTWFRWKTPTARGRGPGTASASANSPTQWVMTTT